jgi:hypothetical protein
MMLASSAVSVGKFVLVSTSLVGVGEISSAVAVTVAGLLSGFSINEDVGLAGIDEQDSSRVMPSRKDSPGDFFTFLTINPAPETRILTGI